MGPAAEAVRAAILAFFLNLGYQPFEANALVGHAWLETRLTPCAVGGAAHFLFQWEGARLRRLARFARTSGCPPLATQLRFADRELRTIAAYSCFWAATTERAALLALRRGFGGGHC